MIELNPIAEHRKRLGLSLRELAARLTGSGAPTHHGTIADWESDEYLPCRLRLRVLARAFGVRPGALEDELLDWRRRLGARNAS